MLKRALSRLTYGALVASGAARAFRHLNRSKLAILMYHGLHGGDVDRRVNFDGLHLHVDRFRRQMQYLAKHCRVVPLERYREPSPGDNRVVLTFDDGYASFYRHAYPVLRELGLAATVFVATDFVGSGDLMWWDRLRLAVCGAREPAIAIEWNGSALRLSTDSPDAKHATLHFLHDRLKRLPRPEQDRILDTLDNGGPSGDARAPFEPLTVEQIREMVDHGMSFQSHAVSHTSFATLSDDELRRELVASKTSVEEWTRRKVAWLAYPFGHVDARATSALVHAGYEGAVTCRESLGHSTDDPFGLPRLSIGDPMSLPQFIAAVSGLREVAIQLRSAVQAPVPA